MGNTIQGGTCLKHTGALARVLQHSAHLKARDCVWAEPCVRLDQCLVLGLLSPTCWRACKQATDSMLAFRRCSQQLKARGRIQTCQLLTCSASGRCAGVPYCL